MLRPTLIALAAAFAFSPFANAQSDWPPKPVFPKDELTPEQHKQLVRDKLIIGKKDYNQIFSPYLELGKTHESIRFITSDAALAAYHALFEDSFRELELRRAVRLRGDMEELYKSCRHKTKENSKVPELIQHILGPALVILGIPATTDYFSEFLLPEIKRQVTLIQNAESSECPPWLDYKNDPRFKIDYRRCKPVSFYVGNPTLENYHRAVRWLQMTPLRAENNRELKTWARLTEAISPQGVAPAFQRSFTGLGNFVGPLEDRGIVTKDPAIHEVIRKGHWKESNLLETLRAAILAAEPAGTKLADIRLHVMPAHILPDSELLFECIKHNIRPNGLTVAAYLGSDFAHKRMPKVDLQKWIEWSIRARLLELPQDGTPRSLYIDYLDLLRTLNAPPVENAPAFMRTQPWLAKICQTQLAGWVQMRHTFALQAKNAIYFDAGEPEGYPPGFIEPNPEFWREYTQLIERTISMLNEQHVFERSPAAFADEMRRQADKLESLKLHLSTANLGTLGAVYKSTDFDPHILLDGVTRWLVRTKAERIPGFLYDSPEEMRGDYKYAIDWLRLSADKVDRGEQTIDEEYFRIQPLSERWQILATLSRQLEPILAKQLAEIELTETERTLIISFGDTLAESMGFFGHSKNVEPLPDTTPRWVEVAHYSRSDQSLGVATGRARALFVLYPWRGRELLCTGAVLSYYEEWAPTKRLTDEEWKQKLDSPAAPPPPDWLAPILAK